MDEPWRIVILGKTGSGKSSLANTIFGKDLFKVSHSPKSETSDCKIKNKSVNGRHFTLVDTPGFFDTNISEDKLKPEIVRCITECAPGPRAVLIVLKVEKSTEQEQAVIDKVKEHCSEEVFKYAIVIFTHGDQLPKGQTIIEFVKGNESLSDLVKKCGDRCHVIDNKYWNKRRRVKKKNKYRSNKFQSKEILKTLDKMVAEQKGDYTNDTLQEVEQEIQQEEEQIRQSSTNMSKEEIREKAKDKVFEKLLIRLTGTATGALLGALLGVATFTDVVIKAVKTATAGSASDDTGAGAGAASRAITAPIVVAGIGVAVAAGIPAGAAVGYHASKRADTPQEAAKMALEAVVDGAGNVIEKTSDVFDKVSQKKVKHSSLC